MIGLLSLGPASIRAILKLVLVRSLFAIILPAEPAPIIAISILFKLECLCYFS